MNQWRGSCVTLLALAACSRTGERQTESNGAQAVPVVNEAQPTVPAPGPGPTAPTPLAHSTDRLGCRGLESVQRGSGLIIVGGRIIVLGAGPGEIIGEPDDPGGPDERPPAVLENRAGAHRDHGRQCRALAFKIVFPL